MSRYRYQSRRAFTLVELLTVMAIIGVLAGLLLPALAAAREAMRRAQCLQNITQMAKATRTYESVYRVLPPAGKGIDKTAFAAFLGGNTNAEYIKAGRYRVGIGDTQNGSGPMDTSPSVFLTLLPYLDNAPLYDQYNHSYEYNDIRASKNPDGSDFVDKYEKNPTLTRFGNIGTATADLRFYRCPSSPMISLKDPRKFGTTDYAATVYTDIFPGTQYNTDPLLASFTPGSWARRSTQEGALGLKVSQMSAIPDGESNTTLFIEDAGRADFLQGYGTVTSPARVSALCASQGQFGYGCMPASAFGSTDDPQNGGRQFYSVHRWADSNASGIGISGQYVEKDGDTPGGYINNSNSKLGGVAPYLWKFYNCGNNEEAYSFHRGGANVVMVDTSAHFLSEEVDPVTLRFLVTKAEKHAFTGKPFE